MKLFQSKIDRLVNRIRKNEIKKQKAEDRKNKRNSALGRKIAKCEDMWQYYQNKSILIANETTAYVEELNRQIKKDKKQIKLEKEYYDDVVFEEQRKGGKHE